MRWRPFFDAEYLLIPQAVRLAFNMPIEPYLNELIANGRGNISVLLASTMALAWTSVLFQRGTLPRRTSSAATREPLRRVVPSRASAQRPRNATLIDLGFSGLAWSGAIMLQASCLAPQPGVARQNSVRALACKVSITSSSSCQ